MSTSGVASTGHMKEKAGDAAEQAREQVTQATEKARGRVRTQVDERSTQAGERVMSQADDIRSIGSSLREQGNSSAADMADQAAQRIERAGTWLRDSDADEILERVEDTARSNPWAVLAGGLAAGFAISRVLKASSGDRYRARQMADGGPSTYDRPTTQAPAIPRSGRFTRAGEAPGGATMPVEGPSVGGAAGTGAIGSGGV